MTFIPKRYLKAKFGTVPDIEPPGDPLTDKVADVAPTIPPSDAIAGPVSRFRMLYRLVWRRSRDARHVSGADQSLRRPQTRRAPRRCLGALAHDGLSEESRIS